MSSIARTSLCRMITGMVFIVIFVVGMDEENRDMIGIMRLVSLAMAEDILRRRCRRGSGDRSTSKVKHSRGGLDVVF